MECHVKINSEVIWGEFSGLLSLQKKMGKSEWWHSYHKLIFPSKGAARKGDYSKSMYLKACL